MTQRNVIVEKRWAYHAQPYVFQGTLYDGKVIEDIQLFILHIPQYHDNYSDTIRENTFIVRQATQREISVYGANVFWIRENHQNEIPMFNVLVGLDLLKTDQLLFAQYQLQFLAKHPDLCKNLSETKDR